MPSGKPLRLENSREVKPLNSKKIGDRLKNAGFWVSYESHYLLERNWIQLCLMSDVPKARLRDFAAALENTLSQR